MARNQDYVLGVHAAELARLGLQHRAWRAHALELWRKAGLRAGARVLDFGCGPGFAALDLAELVGESGRVLGVDRSEAFLAHLAQQAQARGYGNVETRAVDLSEPGVTLGQFEFAWARWIFAFTPDLEAALDAFADALAPGGVCAVQEYLDYGVWRMLPREPAVEDFCATVMASWRARGGEPNAAPLVAAGLLARGFEIISIEPVCAAVTPQDPVWDWPESFVLGNAPRLVELGDLSPAQGEAVVQAWARARARPGVRMLTPLTGLILARKPEA